MQDQTMLNNKRKQILLIFGGVALFIIVAAIIINIIIRNVSDSTDIVRIENLSSCAVDVPHDTAVWVEKRAHQYVAAQLEVDNRGAAKSQYQGSLRQDSCELREFKDDEDHSGYTAEFILDIAELQYSFQVTFDYVKSGSPELVDTDMGTPTLYCLSTADLIYPAFDCANNPLINNSGITELYDIRNLIPYADPGNHYYLQLAASTETKSGYTIVINYLPGTEYYLNGDIETYRQTYRAAAEEYLTSNHQNLSDFDFFEKWK